jgi:pyocin large subunit-like protein
MISGSMAAKQTRGFKSLLHRIDHFTAHGKGLGMPTEEDYESFADQFLGQPCPKGVRQFTRSWNGDVVRYDENVDVFGILDCNGFIKTCYRPDPSFHGEKSNLDYYLAEEANS